MSVRQVKSLRLSGELAFLPGRPVRIDERDLDDYRERARAAAAALPRHRRIGPPTPKEVADAASIARQILMRRNHFRRQMARARAANPER